MDGLREQILINQFVMTAGCSPDQARKYLIASQWQYETALSIFFSEGTVPMPNRCRNCGGTHNHLTVCAPTNTPATPPQFPDALAAFKNLSASDHNSFHNSNSANAGGGTPQNNYFTPPTQHQQTSHSQSQSTQHIEVGK